MLCTTAGGILVSSRRSAVILFSYQMHALMQGHPDVTAAGPAPLRGHALISCTPALVSAVWRMDVGRCQLNFSRTGSQGTSLTDNHLDDKIIRYIIVAEYGFFLFAVIVAAIYYCYKCHQPMSLDSEKDNMKEVPLYKFEVTKIHKSSCDRKNGYDFWRRPGLTMNPTWHTDKYKNETYVYLKLLDVEDGESSEEGIGEDGKDV